MKLLESPALATGALAVLGPMLGIVQAKADLVAAMPYLDLPLEFTHLPVQFLEVLQQPINQQPEASGQFVLPASSINSGILSQT